MVTKSEGELGSSWRSRSCSRKYFNRHKKQYREALQKALRAGYEILEKNGSSLEAVEASIKILENCPLINAGRCSVLTEGQ